MKKLSVLLAVFILAAGVAFAQEDNGFFDEPPPPERPIEFFNMEISIGFPVHWTNGKHDDGFYPGNPPDLMMEDKLVTANTSIGVALVFNFTRTFGLTMDFDFFYGAKLAGFASPTSDYNSLAGANIYIGPLFYIFNNNVLRMPLAFGAHMYYFTDDLWVTDLNSDGAWLNRHEFQFGPFISLGIQFHFSRDIYIFSKTNVAIDLVRMHKIYWIDATDPNDRIYDERQCTDVMNINWSLKPSIGLGIKY